MNSDCQNIITGYVGRIDYYLLVLKGDLPIEIKEQSVTVQSKSISDEVNTKTYL